MLRRDAISALGLVPGTEPYAEAGRDEALSELLSEMRELRHLLCRADQPQTEKNAR